MSDFSQRLRSEMEYAGLTRKELAAKAGIQKRALDTYLEAQQSMPPADKAVKIAAALGLSVEYLVTGKERQRAVNVSRYLQFKDITDDLAILSTGVIGPIKTMIKAFAESERRKGTRKEPGIDG